MDKEEAQKRALIAGARIGNLRQLIQDLEEKAKDHNTPTDIYFLASDLRVQLNLLCDTLGINR